MVSMNLVFDHIIASPFRPFSVRLADGQSFEVFHQVPLRDVEALEHLGPASGG